MLRMYEILHAKLAQKNVSIETSTATLSGSEYDMRGYKKFQTVWQYVGFVRLALVLLVCVASVTIPPSVICTRIKGLSAKQMRFCENNPGTMQSITDGFQLGLEECKYQFRKRRWNCTSLGSRPPFSNHAVPGTKESAFTHAIISAGIAHAVALACTKGNVTKLKCCDSSLKGTKSEDGWSWGGCSVNINRGINVANAFLDGQDPGQSDIALMNKHNNEVGRKVLNNSLVLECKCHGTSSLCNVRTCWKRLPSFRTVGHRLHVTYSSHSVMVKKAVSSSLVLVSDNYRKPKKTEIVYLRESPNYCERNLTRGLLGTKGRLCIKDTSDREADVCDIMCCGRGYDTRIVTRKWKCNCKFHWCCYVKCKSCSEKAILHTCK